MPWFLIISLIVVLILATAFKNVTMIVFTLYRLFLLFRMVVLLPLTVLFVYGACHYYKLMGDPEPGYAELVYIALGGIVYLIAIFIVDAIIDQLAARHNIKLY